MALDRRRGELPELHRTIDLPRDRSGLFVLAKQILSRSLDQMQ
jgi:hypothetical protein